MIPGINKISFNRKSIPDLIFFILVVALPSSFFNFIPQEIFIDLKSIFLLVGILYLLFNIKYLKKITKIKGGKLLIFLVIFLIFRYIYSILILEINWIEVTTIFRSKFFYPIVTLGFLCHASKMNNNRIYRFFYWLLLITLWQGLLYSASNLLEIDFYANAVKDFYSFNNTIIIQNLNSLPKYNIILFVFALISALIFPKFKKHWLWVIPVIVTMISIVRNQIIVYTIVPIVLYYFTLFSKVELINKKVIQLIFTILLSSFLTYLLFPSHIDRIINKFGFDKQEQVNISSYTEEGTFKVRLNLIEDAYNRTDQNKKLMFGNGYIRESQKGEYDFVLGGDTLIAPVLFTEGLFGILIRCLPILYFLYFGFKNLKNKNRGIAIFSILILTLIVPEFFNAVQTTLFVNYHHVLFIIYLLMIILYNDEKMKTRITKTKN